MVAQFAIFLDLPNCDFPNSNPPELCLKSFQNDLDLRGYTDSQEMYAFNLGSYLVICKKTVSTHNYVIYLFNLTTQ